MNNCICSKATAHDLKPLKANPLVPVAFALDQLVLHWGYACAVMCNYGSLCQRMEVKSICKLSALTDSSYLGHVSNALGQTKEHKQLLSKQ